MSRFPNRQKEPAKVSLRGRPAVSKSSNPVAAWFENYWYYYKIPFVIGAAVLTLAVWMIVDIATKVEQDFRLYCITDTLLLEEEYDAIAQAMAPYAVDVDGDGRTVVSPSYIQLPENPSDEMGMMAYQQIMTVFVDEEISLLVVDEFTYQYLIASEALSPLSVYGVTGTDEYRIRLNDTSFMLDNAAAKRADFYLVIKVRIENSRDKPRIQARFDVAQAVLQAAAAEAAAAPKTETKP